MEPSGTLWSSQVCVCKYQGLSLVGLKIAALHYGTKSNPDYATSARFPPVETLMGRIFKHHSGLEQQVFGANVAMKKAKRAKWSAPYQRDSGQQVNLQKQKVFFFPLSYVPSE